MSRGRDALVVLGFEQIRSGEVIHAGRWIDEVERHGKIHVLQGSASKAAHVIGLERPSAGKRALNRCDDLRRVRRLHTIVHDVGEGLRIDTRGEWKTDRTRRRGAVPTPRVEYCSDR